MYIRRGLRFNGDPNDLLLLCVHFCCHPRSFTDSNSERKSINCSSSKLHWNKIEQLINKIRNITQKGQHRKGRGNRETLKKKQSSSKYSCDLVVNALKLHVFFWSVLLVFDYVRRCLKLALLELCGSKPARALICLPLSCDGNSSLNWVPDLSSLHTTPATQR